MSRNFEVLRRLDGRALGRDGDGVGEPLFASRPGGTVSGSGEMSATLEIAPELHDRVHQVFCFPGVRSPRFVAFSVLGPPRLHAVCARAGELLGRDRTTRVCVVDACLDNRLLTEYFQLGDAPGLREALEGDPAAAPGYCQQPSGTALSVLPAGGRMRKWRPLLESDAARQSAAELCRRFDYVLLDVPPLDGLVDLTPLCAGLDGLILVFEANATRRKDAARAARLARAAGIRLLGAVLNDSVSAA